MMMDDNMFFAWLDGELDTAAATKVAAEVAADPELQRRAVAHRSLRTRLGNAFAPIAAAPVPGSILAIAEPDKVIDFTAVRKRRSFGLPSAVQWAAMAATLVLGLATGSIWSGARQVPVTSEAGQLMASAGLEQALDTRLASAPAGPGPRIGLTFRDDVGSICRSFTDGVAQGLACRDGKGWRIRGMFQGPQSTSGDFRMAASIDPTLAALIDSTIAGEPFDAATERRALARNWR